MADIKISELGVASAVNSTDIFPMTSSGITVKATAQQIKNYMGVGNLADLTTDAKTDLVAAINEVDAHADAAQQMIAPILTSLVAPSGGLGSGDRFIYNGLLYKATAAIAAGSTITIDGNAILAESVTEWTNAIRKAFPYGLLYPSEMNNLNSLNNLGDETFSLNKFGGGAANIPTPNSGVVLTFKKNGASAVQFAFTLNDQLKLYIRNMVNYSWSSWRAV